MLRQEAVHRENRFSSWRNETGLLRFFDNKATQIFSGQSDWPADNSRKVRLAGVPATAGSLPPMQPICSPTSQSRIRPGGALGNVYKIVDTPCL